MSNCVMCGRDFEPSQACPKCEGYRNDLLNYLRVLSMIGCPFSANMDASGSTTVVARATHATIYDMVFDASGKFVMMVQP